MEERRKLDRTRASLTREFWVGGMQCFATIGFYPDGTIGELFAKIAKEGSTLSGFLRAFSTLFSISLQHGAPLSTCLDKIRGTRFEPNGWTDIGEVTSVLDYIARWIEEVDGRRQK